MKRNYFNPAAMLLLLVLGTAVSAQPRLFVGLADGSFDGVAQFGRDLAFFDQVAVDGPVRGLSHGLQGEFYAGSGNSVTRYDDAGNVLGSVSGTATTQVRDLSFSGTQLYVGLVDSPFQGVAMFDPGLGLNGQVEVASSAGGTAHGPLGTFYVGGGDTVYKYLDDGTLDGSISGSPTTVLIDAAFSGTHLYVSLRDGTFNAVAVFDADLGFVDQIELGGPVDALAAGLNGEFYAASGNTVYWLDSTGSVLGSVSGTTSTRIRDMSFNAVPEPTTVGVLALGLFAVLKRRRKGN